MIIDIMTLFPDMCEAVLSTSIIGRARTAQLVEVNCVNIRDYAQNKHRHVDDAPYGGGMGMVMSAQPIYDCYKSIKQTRGTKPHTIYLSPQGSVLTQQKAIDLSKLDNICLLCGHYEGVDKRVIDEIVDEEISIGDYVLTGGELPALVLVDSVVRLLEGVLSDSACFENESHFNGLLEHPHYTRPQEFLGRKVPDVLLSGHDKNIDTWRKEQSLLITKQKRPDLLK